MQLETSGGNREEKFVQEFIESATWNSFQQRFAQTWALQLAEWTRSPIQLTYQLASQQALQTWLTGLDGLEGLQLITGGCAGGPWLLHCEAATFYSLASRFLGQTEENLPSRYQTFSSFEERVFQRIGNAFLSHWQQAWQAIIHQEVALKLLSLDSKLPVLRALKGDQVYTVLKWKVSIEQTVGDVQLLLPASTWSNLLPEIYKKLEEQTGSNSKESSIVRISEEAVASDSNLSKKEETAHVSLRLPSFSIKRLELLNLRPGDFLTTDIPVSSNFELWIESLDNQENQIIPVDYGEYEGKKAAKPTGQMKRDS
ncbi:Hypothetical protein PBC10988_7780 [Planctomycetales bacterium 10988]|nr:Hypothetical protein PBC10988_7780 [Planctomycetales bacterium 10988]